MVWLGGERWEIFDVFQTLLLRFNLTRDLSRYVRMVIRSPLRPHFILFATFFSTFCFCIELPINLPIAY